MNRSSLAVPTLDTFEVPSTMLWNADPDSHSFPEEYMTSESKEELLFIIPSLVFRGAEKMLVNLVNQFDHSRFSIQVISLSRNNPIASQICPDAATFTALPRAWRYDMSPAWELRKLIKRKKIDAILAFDIFSFFYIWVALWGIQPRPRIFISIHNIKFKSYRHWIQSFIYARLLSGKEVFLSVCDAQIDYWTRTYRIPRSSFVTIHNGVDTGLFSPSSEPRHAGLIRNRLGIPQDAFVILQVANLTLEKRHEDALLALKQLLNEVKAPVVLVCVGDGVEGRKHALEQLAKNLGIHAHVLFPGVHHDVKPYFEIADLFSLTSSSETFSMAALEAMSMGVPCVLTDVGGAREMIVEGMNGYLVCAGHVSQIAERWAVCFKNRHSVDRQKIRDWVIRNYSLPECVRKYENMLCNAAQGRIIGVKHGEKTQSF